METIEEKLEVKSRLFRVNLLQLENASVAFFFEDRMRMGTVAIAMPGTGEVAVGRSSVLVGGKYLMTTRALAERLAAKTAKIALVSLFTELDEAEALRMYAKLIDKIPAASHARPSPQTVNSI
jgi:ribosomal protein L30E